MPKRVILIVLLTCTILSLGTAVFRPEQAPAKVRFATVQRGDVHQVAAIRGQLAYTGEAYIYAPASGMIKRLCVQENQRVEAGGLIACLDSTQHDQAMSAMVGGLPEQAVTALAPWTDNRVAQTETVLRSPSVCTVRQVLAQEGTPVAAGSPVCRVSSNQQQIICSVSTVDAGKISVGMWAWITSEGEAVGTAVVQAVGKAEADASTGLCRTRVTMLPEGHIDLPEGTALDVDVYLVGSDDVLSLPLEAITDRGTVWWVNEGRCTEIPAQIVLCNEMNAWVDLPEGLTVALGELKEGQRVVEADE